MQCKSVPVVDNSLREEISELSNLCHDNAVTTTDVMANFFAMSCETVMISVLMCKYLLAVFAETIQLLGLKTKHYGFRKMPCQ